MNKIGFGFLRLPLLDPKNDQTTDYEELNRLSESCRIMSLIVAKRRHKRTLTSEYYPK